MHGGEPGNLVPADGPAPAELLIRISRRQLPQGAKSSGWSALVSSIIEFIRVDLQYINWGLAPRAALGVLALLCGNGYIVGINQIYDVDIDTINKPFLPVAAGTLCAWLPML